MLRPIETLLLLHTEDENVQDVISFFTSKDIIVRTSYSAANINYDIYDKVLVTLEVAKRLHASSNVTVLLDSYEQLYIMIPVCADSFVTRDTLIFALYTNKEKREVGKRANRKKHHLYIKELENLIEQHKKVIISFTIPLEVKVKVLLDFSLDIYKINKKSFYLTESEKLFLYQYFIAGVPRERKTIKYKLIKKLGVNIFDAQYKDTV